MALLILPYLLFDPGHYLYALGSMLAAVVLIILGFNYYIAVAKGLSFKRRFAAMAGISLGVAALSFCNRTAGQERAGRGRVSAACGRQAGGLGSKAVRLGAKKLRKHALFGAVCMVRTRRGERVRRALSFLCVHPRPDLQSNGKGGR